MTVYTDPLSRLPELPLELFERSGKLEYAEWAPVITIRPVAITAVPPLIPTAAESKASYTITSYFAWVSYPQVICYPFPDQVSPAALSLENSKPDLRQNETDLRAIAGAQRYYKLRRLNGVDLPIRYGCHVRYGPWGASVRRTSSCFEGVPDMWELSTSVPDLNVQWYGTWEDIPSVANLTVFMGSLSDGTPKPMCCHGYAWCPTTGSCIPDALNCQDPTL